MGQVVGLCSPMGGSRNSLGGSLSKKKKYIYIYIYFLNLFFDPPKIKCEPPKPKFF